MNQRINYLDSLRGIAALSVVAFHLIDKIISSFNLTNNENNKIILRVLFNGTDWVSFFFVLSGFSLSFGVFQLNKKIKLFEYFIKRIFRLYPIFIVGLLISFFISTNKNNSGLLLLRESLLIPRYCNILIVDWSLSIEILCSLLIPFLIIIYKHSTKLFYIFTTCSLMFYNTIGNSQTSFTGFIFHFCLGMVIAGNYHRIKEIKIKPIYLNLILLCSLLLFGARWYLYKIDSIYYIFHLSTDILNMDIHQGFYIITALCSSYFIFYAIKSKKLQFILSNKILLYLGTISYSVYILHKVIIELSFHFIVKYMNTTFAHNLYLVGVSTLISIFILIVIFSSFGYFLIEKKFINFATKIVKINFVEKHLKKGNIII